MTSQGQGKGFVVQVIGVHKRTSGRLQAGNGQEGMKMSDEEGEVKRQKLLGFHFNSLG